MFKSGKLEVLLMEATQHTQEYLAQINEFLGMSHPQRDEAVEDRDLLEGEEHLEKIIAELEILLPVLKYSKLVIEAEMRAKKIEPLRYRL